jgi:uncharacterized protein (DUF2249 family)
MVTIYRDTKIAQIIKANKDSIEAIASVAAPLQKLRNPLLRKLLAGRVTLAEAATMGGCDIAALGAALAPLGFAFDDRNRTEERQKQTGSPAGSISEWLGGSPVTRLDVREDLASGQDPLKKIMSAVKGLPEGNALLLINSFEPTPLVTLLDRQGFDSRVERAGPGEVHAYFRLRGREEKTPGGAQEVPELVGEDRFNEKLEEFGGKVVALDVSSMEMPMPMVTILEALAALPATHALSVTHKRVPVFLFPELKDRNFSYMLHKAAEADVRLLVFKETAQ